jgi:hypothetical protein
MTEAPRPLPKARIECDALGRTTYSARCPDHDGGALHKFIGAQDGGWVFRCPRGGGHTFTVEAADPEEQAAARATFEDNLRKRGLGPWSSGAKARLTVLDQPANKAMTDSETAGETPAP